jgi:hypothetical protein
MVEDTDRYRSLLQDAHSASGGSEGGSVVINPHFWLVARKLLAVSALFIFVKVFFSFLICFKNALDLYRLDQF